MKKQITHISMIVAVLFGGCGKVYYYPDDPVQFERSIILSHHGEKDTVHGENTYEACVKALADYDGLEVDVQISKDQTLWLSHSSEVTYCDGSATCFVETSDEDIESITTCNGADMTYTKLEDVLSYMDENNIRKPLSIDIKGWAPCNGGTLDIEGIMRLEAEEAISLAEKYHLVEYLLFENELPSVLNWAKKRVIKFRPSCIHTEILNSKC
ncbi:MAG TPA: glycerophosphodiester phosphodiesterase family protein [Chitinophagales bacterium]|nr:glycerophosphodiester phosphodiesterase family protein [Chitinophagales bacterium]